MKQFFTLTSTLAMCALSAYLIGPVRSYVGIQRQRIDIRSVLRERSIDAADATCTVGMICVSLDAGLRVNPACTQFVHSKGEARWDMDHWVLSGLNVDGGGNCDVKGVIYFE